MELPSFIYLNSSNFTSEIYEGYVDSQTNWPVIEFIAKKVGEAICSENLIVKDVTLFQETVVLSILYQYESWKLLFYGD